MGVLGPGSGQAVGNPLRTVVNTFRAVTSNTKKVSISRMANQSIFQYPCIASGGIETNKLATIAKAIEGQLAAYNVASLSMNSTVNLNKYESVNNYLSKFHNNSDINPNIMAMISGATEATNTFSIADRQYFALECWNELYPDDVLDTESLNEIYCPYNRTKQKIQSAINTAMEAKGDFRKKWNLAQDEAKRQGWGEEKKLKDQLNSMNNHPGSNIRGKGPIKTWQKTYDKDGNVNSGKMRYSVDPNTRVGIKAPAIRKDASLSTMEPTLIEVSFNVHGHGDGNWEQNVVIGIKAMLRPVRSDIVVANMVEAVQSSNSIFDFIKYTDKEIQTALQLFGPIKSIKDTRDIVNANYAGDTKFMRMIQKRKLFNSAQKILGAPVPPTVTIIITSAEAEIVKQITGVDLNNIAQAKRMMDKYYILAFGIFDNDLDELKIVFDGDNDWAVNTIYSLARLNSSNKGTYMDMARNAEMLGRK